MPRREWIAQQASGRRGQLTRLALPPSGLDDPPDKVAAPHPARRPRGPAAGQRDAAAIRVQLFGNLAAGLPAADDQHRPRLERVRAAVFFAQELVDTRWDLRRVGRPERTLVSTRRDDHASRRDPAARRAEPESLAVGVERRHSAPLTNRGPEGISPSL